MTMFSSREFNQDVTRAKKATQTGPVFITDRGRPAHVLLSIEGYRRLTKDQPNLIELLAMPEEVADIEFEPPRLAGPLFRPAEWE